MRGRRAGALWLLAWCGPLLLVAFGVLLVRAGRTLPSDVHDFENIYPNLVFGSVVPLLGALILGRLPGHAVGRLFLACGLASALTLAVYPYAWLGLGPAHLPGALGAAWVSEWIWGLGFTPLVTIGVLLFPDGRPPGPRWRLLLWSDLLGISLVFLSNAFHPGPLQNHPVVTNPLGLPLPRTLFAAIGTAGFALFGVGMVGGAVAAVLRWRRARGAERAQLSWFAFTVAALAIAVLAPVPKILGDAVTVVAIPLLPVSVAVAILRRDLYGIEVVVRRSLAYAGLTVVLLIGYAGTVAALGAALQDRAGTTEALVATAVVAVAFSPVRSRLQRAVDRVLYGDRRDPYTVLSGLGRRLGATEAGTDALTEVAGTVASSLRLPYVRVEVCRPGEEPLVAEHGGPSTAALHEVPLAFRGDPVGRLLVSQRTVHDPFRAADLRLLDDLGRQIGVAAHSLLVTRDLQRSREALVTTREEERRRIRRDLHDGLGPTLAGVALGLDAAGRLVAAQPEQAVALTTQLREEVESSLGEVRRLIEDLRPPELDQLGLLGALERHARRLTERDPGLDVELASAQLPPLSAAVEVATYRIVAEALTNVSRHAGARSCRVGLAVCDQTLLIEVEDDGVGLPDSRRYGVGLGAMRERANELGGTCAAQPRTGGGTCVAAVLPLGKP